jgi:hypothetical protein
MIEYGTAKKERKNSNVQCVRTVYRTDARHFHPAPTGKELAKKLAGLGRGNILVLLQYGMMVCVLYA